jgi:hypothetical protein
MGFGDDHHAADPEGVELVEDHVHDGGVRALGRFDERALHGLEVADGVEIAIEQLEQQVTSQRVQSILLLVPLIYSTSPATHLVAVIFTGKFSRGPRNSFTVGSGVGDCKQKTCSQRAFPLQSRRRPVK